MLLTYLDESYTKDRFYIAASGCPDEDAIKDPAATVAVGPPG